MRIFVILSLASLFFLCSCEEKKAQESTGSGEREAASENEPWKAMRGGAGLRGSVSASVSARPEVVWTHESEFPIVCEVVAENGVAIVANDGGWVYALEMESGKSIWKKEMPEGVSATCLLWNERVYVPCEDGVLYALDLKNGEQVWSYETGHDISAGVNFCEYAGGARLFINGHDGLCRCLNAETGEEIWICDTESCLSGACAVVDEKWVVFGSSDLHVYTLNLKDGKIVNQITTEAEVTATVATDQNFVAFGNYAHEVTFADIFKKEAIWTYTDRNFPFMSSPAIGENAVYIGGRDKKLHAISRADGSEMWQVKTGGRIDSSPALFDDAVVFGSYDGRLYALDPATGKTLWKIDLGESIIAPVSYAEGMLLVSDEAGTTFALGW